MNVIGNVLKSHAEAGRNISLPGAKLCQKEFLPSPLVMTPSILAPLKHVSPESACVPFQRIVSTAPYSQSTMIPMAIAQSISCFALVSNSPANPSHPRENRAHFNPGFSKCPVNHLNSATISFMNFGMSI